MQARKKVLATAALTASLTAGGFVGAVFGAPTISSAQSETGQRVERAERPAASRGGPRETMPADRRASAGESRAAEEGDGRGPPGRRPHRRLALEAAAEALGMTAEELRAELRSGKSVRTVAGERNVDVQTVIDAIVAAVTEHAEERATAFVDRQRPAEVNEQQG